ncbi:MAG: aspartyl protease family protein, partial [Actinomycetota bacterium]
VQISLPRSEVQARIWEDPPRMVPGPVRATAVIDTGAEMTTVRPQTAEALLFDRPVRTVPLAGANTTQEAPIYAVSIAVGPPHNTSVSFELNVAVAQLIEGPHDCLLGRDVLQRGGLAWYGDASEYQLVFPAATDG